MDGRTPPIASAFGDTDGEFLTKKCSVEKKTIFFLAEKFFGRKVFRRKNVSAEKCLGHKNFRPKSFSAEKNFGRKIIRPKIFSTKKFFGQIFFWQARSRRGRVGGGAGAPPGPSGFPYYFFVKLHYCSFYATRVACSFYATRVFFMGAVLRPSSLRQL